PDGSGGFADVWKGNYNGELVAVKVIRDAPRSFSGRAESLFREAVIWKYLEHPNITPFYGIDPQNANSSFVSKWMLHGTVMDYLRRNPSAYRLDFVVHVAAGLKYLHDMGIVHGDIKGSNILINEKLIACLADFGLAALSYTEQPNTRSIVGSSLRWSAPEIMNPEAFALHTAAMTRQTDVFAFGVTTWEIFTGKTPFCETPLDATVILRISQGNRPGRPSPADSHGLDDELWDMIDRCWQADYRARPEINDV
ncbi:kinase-like protein, partial [Obba rivulosa]